MEPPRTSREHGTIVPSHRKLQKLFRYDGMTMAPEGAPVHLKRMPHMNATRHFHVEMSLKDLSKFPTSFGGSLHLRGTWKLGQPCLGRTEDGRCIF